MKKAEGMQKSTTTATTERKDKAERSAEETAEGQATRLTISSHFPQNHMGFTEKQIGQLEGTAKDWEKLYGKGAGEMYLRQMKDLVDELIHDIEEPKSENSCSTPSVAPEDGGSNDG